MLLKFIYFNKIYFKFETERNLKKKVKQWSINTNILQLCYLLLNTEAMSVFFLFVHKEKAFLFNKSYVLIMEVLYSQYILNKDCYLYYFFNRFSVSIKILNLLVTQKFLKEYSNNKINFCYKSKNFLKKSDWLFFYSAPFVFFKKFKNICSNKSILFFSNKRLRKNIDSVYKRKIKKSKRFSKSAYPYFFLLKFLYSNIKFIKNVLGLKILED
jgi:hypothetical protein